MADETTSPDGFAANAVIDKDYTLYADTMFGGRVIVAYDPGIDRYTGQVIRFDGSRYVFNDIGCAAHPLDPDESSINNLLQVADMVIKDAEDACRMCDGHGNFPDPPGIVRCAFCENGVPA